MLASKIRPRKEAGQTADAAGSAGVTVSRSSAHNSRRLVYILLAGCLLMAAVATGGAILRKIHAQEGARKKAVANGVVQSELQEKLALDLKRTDNQGVVSDTSALINGKIVRKFTFSNKLLAQYYMYEGVAQYNLGHYSEAAAAYKNAPKYNSAETQAALQGELSAGYAAGERQQLIPILQQLANMSRNPNGLFPSAAQYEYDIQALQHNQQVNL